MLTLLIIGGGVALILFGVRFLRKGLDRLFGRMLGTWSQRIAASRPKAFFSGILVALLAPSSTTVSALAVQTVQSGNMTSRQMIALMLGADIGLTVTVLLISLRLEQYAPILILFGVLLFQFTSSPTWRGIGQAVLSLGLIFIGIGIIKDAAAAASQSRDLAQLIMIGERHPLGLAALGAFLAIALQSSTATIGLVVGLGAAKIIHPTVAVAIVVGANIGIVITTLFMGWNRVESRRLAAGNLMAKLAVAVVTLLALPWVTRLLEFTSDRTDVQAAVTHTFFNVIVASIGLPLVNTIDTVTHAMFPDPPPSSTTRFGPRFLTTGPTDSVPLSLNQSAREIMHVSEIVRRMLGDLWRAIKTNDKALAHNVSERDDQVDLLDNEIKRFLTREIGLQGSPADTREQMRQLRYLNELETIGDIIDKNLTELVLKKIKLGSEFSAEGWQELDEFYGKVTENMLIADTAFSTRDRILAQQLARHKEQLNNNERQLRDRHFERLNAGMAESHETSAIHLDILTHLKRINSCASHVAYAIMQDTDDTT